MADEIDDPLIEAALEEALGGQTPPDLSERIMRAVDAGEVPPHVLHAIEAAYADANSPSHAQPSNRPIPIAADAAAASGDVVFHPAKASLRRPGAGSRASARGRGRMRRVHRTWIVATLSLSLLAACGTYLITRFALQGESRNIAKVPAAKPSSTSDNSASANSKPSTKKPAATTPDVKSPEATTPPADPSSQVAKSSPKNGATPQLPTEVSPAEISPAAPSPTRPMPPEPDVIADAPPTIPADLETPGVIDVPSAPRAAEKGAEKGADRDVVAAIDAQLRASWTAAGVRPSVRASDAEWCRRVYLGILGRIPTLGELERFAGDRSSRKRTALVDRLLGDDYRDEYARHWASFWTTVLLGSQGGTEEGPADRQGLVDYLRRAFAQDVPLDRLASDLIAATGSNQPGDPDYNGAVNFLAAHFDADGLQATAKTAQAFLGRQVQCMQCHNHPFGEGKAEQFWQLNAFFRQMHREPVASGLNSAVRLVDRDVAGPDGSKDDAGIFWEQSNGLMKYSYPVLPDGTAISRSGDIDRVKRRMELGRFVARSPWLAESVVNRMWEHFFGAGFTRQVDDLGPHNPPAHPALFARLTNDWIAGGRDNKAIIRWIVLSEAYGLSSRYSPTNRRDDPSVGEPPLFSRYYLRSMQPEQLFESLVIMTGRYERRLELTKHERDKTKWLSQLTFVQKTDDCAECHAWNGSIPQALLVMNGDLTQQATQSTGGSVVEQLARSQSPYPRKVQQLFLASLARSPSRDEAALAQKLLTARNGQVGPALEDLSWALLNCNEFLMNR